MKAILFDLDGTLLDTEKLGLKPENVLGVEDAPSGVRAAYDAGMRTVMIPDQDEPDEETAALCTLITPTLSGIIPFIRKENELNKHKL